MLKNKNDEMKSIVKKGYDAGKYAKYFGRNSLMGSFEKSYFDRLDKILPASSNILDLGCGTGLPFDLYLTDRSFNITGIDISEIQINNAIQNVKKAKYIAGDFTKYKFKNNSFNAVISLYSIFHIPRTEHKNLLKMIYNYLADDGAILITMGIEETAGIEIDYNFCGNIKMAWSSFDFKKNIDLVEKSGFDIIQYDNEADFGSEEPHLWILAKKK